MNLIIRSLTSLFYVSLLLGSLFIDGLLFSLIICIMTTLAIREIQRISKQKTPLSYLFFPLLFWAATNGKAAEVLTLTLGILGVLFSLAYLSKKNPFFIGRAFITTLHFIGVAVPMVLLAVLGTTKPEYVAFIFGVIWLNDSAAFLVGSWLGKQPLAPTISPNKTIEGSLGGLVFTMVIMTFISSYFNVFTSNSALPIILITTIMASLGDLVQSKLKRHCHVKDCGTILPGHGGMYDRIDSTLLALPIFILLLYLFNYVS